MGDPQNGWLTVENPMKMDDLDDVVYWWFSGGLLVAY